MSRLMPTFATQPRLITCILIMKALNYVVAFLGGAALGASIGLLYAPEKGEVLRKRISKKSKEACDKIEEALRKRGIHLSKDEIGDLVEDIKEDVQLATEA